jgi:hypothetical protein
VTDFFIASLSAVVWFNVGHYFGDAIHLFVKGLIL